MPPAQRSSPTRRRARRSSHLGVSGGAAAASGAAQVCGCRPLGLRSGRPDASIWTVVPVSVQLTEHSARVGDLSRRQASSCWSRPCSASDRLRRGARHDRPFSTCRVTSVAPTTSRALALRTGRRRHRPGVFTTWRCRRIRARPGDGMSFGKVSQPVVTSAGKPFLSGVGPTGAHGGGAGREPGRLRVADRGVEAGHRGDEVPGRDVALALSVARDEAGRHAGDLGGAAPSPSTTPGSGTTACAGFNENLPAGATCDGLVDARPRARSRATASRSSD